MHRASGVLYATAVLFSVSNAWMYWRLMTIRRALDIAARSPTLLACSGLGSLVISDTILVQWALLAEGKGLTCRGKFWVSYFVYGFAFAPYGLRAFRLVIVYHTTYRLKYSRFVKWNVLTRAWFGVVVGMSVYAITIFVYMKDDSYARYKYGCFFFNEATVLGIGLGVAAGPIIFLLYKLLQVDDAYGIKVEIACVLSGCWLGGALTLTILCMISWGLLNASSAVHLVMDWILLGVLQNVFFWSAIYPLAFHYNWCGFRGKRNPFAIVPDARPSQRNMASDGDGVYEYALKAGNDAGGSEEGLVTVAELFRIHCTRSLCAESWEFILACIVYKSAWGLEDQFAKFTAIFDEYLKPTSPQEINISSSMQRSLAACHERDAFMALDEDARKNILEHPMQEIVRLLEQNLLETFKQTPVMQRRLANQRRLKREMEQVEGDTEMEELVRCASIGSNDSVLP